MYKITVLNTAHIDCADSVIYKGGSKDSATTIGCHCFLLENGGRYYLIDTGIENIDVVNTTKTSKADWTRSDDEHTVCEHLEKLGISCDDITKIFVTHMHYDHISAARHFKNAKFYMTKTEYDNFLNDKTSVQSKVLCGVKEFMTRDKVVLFDDELDVDGIKLKLRGGHTKGSMSLETDKNLFVGDTIFTHENLIRKIPAGYTADRDVSDRLLCEYLKYNGKIITSHDINEVKNNV